MDISQEALALKSGINRTYIGSLESGDRNPSLENISRLATALKVDAADLVRGLQKLRGGIERRRIQISWPLIKRMARWAGSFPAHSWGLVAGSTGARQGPG